MNRPIDDRRRKQEVLQCLKQLYIGEPRRSRLAALPHITRDYIIDWHFYLLADMGELYHPRLLIHKLESGEPVPEFYCNPQDGREARVR